MNEIKLINMLEAVGLKVEEVKPRVYKGNSCNVRSWHSFRIWINKSKKVTIKSHGVQKSFDIKNAEQLQKELRGFELL